MLIDRACSSMAKRLNDRVLILFSTLSAEAKPDDLLTVSKKFASWDGTFHGKDQDDDIYPTTQPAFHHRIWSTSWSLIDRLGFRWVARRCPQALIWPRSSWSTTSKTSLAFPFDILPSSRERRSVFLRAHNNADMRCQTLTSLVMTDRTWTAHAQYIYGESLKQLPAHER